MNWKTGLRARIVIKGTLVCKNAAGEVIKNIELDGSIPLSESLGVSEEQAQEIVQQLQQSQQEPST